MGGDLLHTMAVFGLSRVSVWAYGPVGVGIAIARDHRVAGGSRPPPAPTERSVRISRTTLFESCFTARRELVTPDRGDTALVATEGTVP